MIRSQKKSNESIAMLTRNLTTVLFVLNAAWLAAQDAVNEPAKGKSVFVKLVDNMGNPVAGADVGTMAAIGKYVKERAAKEGTEWFYLNHTRSDGDGMAKIENADEWLGHLCVVARHERRGIVAVANIDPANASEPVVVALHPERKVVGRTSCPELPEPRREIKSLIVYVRFENKNVLETVWDSADFELSLPAGKYSLDIYGSGTYRSQPTIEVAAENSPLNLEPITLRASRLALLEGQPAPEIPEVEAWKNSPPVKLADLRGKCVILDFWGYWCGSCVYRMPDTFKLYDKYRDQGLEVIGIHVDGGEDENPPVTTVAELDKRLEETRKTLWDGRDVPYPVALVRGESTPYGEGIDHAARSAAAATWGVISYPTHILIDRSGKVVGKFHPNEEGIKLLEQKLAEK
jgi:thiol-disulfide isomerase/thioredoxin